MVKQRPPSPPSSHSDELQYDLHHLVHHNTNMPYHTNQYDCDDASIAHSGQQTSHESSVSALHESQARHTGLGLSGQQYPNVRFLREYRDPTDVGLGIEVDNYSTSNTPSYHGSDYAALPLAQQIYLPHSVNQNSPPTPTLSDHSSGGQLSRSVRSYATSRSPRSSRPLPQGNKSRVMKAPRMKRKTPKQGKGDKSNRPKISAPLSELTKDWAHIPIRNMEEWVNRSTEVRNQEKQRREGYITRPMNSFMLYRSAFAERTKVWCLQNNHQVVSSVSGESWPLEPDEVREQYTEYAKTERNNHQIAHPNYKFSPSKAQVPVPKRNFDSDADEESEPSDLEDNDLDWGSQRQRRTKMKQIRSDGKDAGYQLDISQREDFRNRALESRGSRVNKSSYQATNPGKPLPAAMNEADLFGHYYETTIHANTLAPNIEDVRIRKTETPGMQYSGTAPLIGLPGGQHYELLQQSSYGMMPASMEEAQLDPLLLAYDSNHIGQSGGRLLAGGDGSFDNMASESHFGASYGLLGADYEQDSLHEYLSGAHQPISNQQVPPYSLNTRIPGEHIDFWQADSGACPLDAGSEFDKWMEEQH
ncbi:MAG: hypothetical protein M1827_003311 [Pycnora praestabilis]|nr:MAG: hypothetical protein M1827_003311 [Pycnora praestabilis]